MQRPGLIKVAAGIQACLEGYQLAGFPGMHNPLNFRLICLSSKSLKEKILPQATYMA
jgi:hypothetical protein